MRRYLSQAVSCLAASEWVGGLGQLRDHLGLGGMCLLPEVPFAVPIWASFSLQESFLPSLVLQSILKRGRPKGYRLLLPSTNRQQAQR